MLCACHLKPPVTAGTRLSVTEAGLKSPIPIPSRYFFFFFFVRCGGQTGTPRLPGWVLWERFAGLQSHIQFLPRFSAVVALNCWIWGIFCDPPPPVRRDFPSSRADPIPRQNIPAGRHPARRSFPATDRGEFWRRICFSSSLVPWGAQGWGVLLRLPLERECRSGR